MSQRRVAQLAPASHKFHLRIPRALPAALCTTPAFPRFIKQLNSFCWNDNGEQPPGPNAVTISIDLGEGTPCPSTAAEFAQLDGDLFTVSGRLLKASVNVVTVLFEPVEGGSCVPVSALQA